MFGFGLFKRFYYEHFILADELRDSRFYVKSSFILKFKNEMLLIFISSQLHYFIKKKGKTKPPPPSKNAVLKGKRKEMKRKKEKNFNRFLPAILFDEDRPSYITFTKRALPVVLQNAVPTKESQKAPRSGGGEGEGAGLFFSFFSFFCWGGGEGKDRMTTYKIEFGKETKKPQFLFIYPI